MENEGAKEMSKYINIDKAEFQAMYDELMQGFVLIANVQTKIIRRLREEAEKKEAYKSKFKLISCEAEAESNGK